MNSISLPRSIRVERFVAKVLRTAIPLASLGVLGFLIFGSSHPGSTAVAVLVLFALALPLAMGSLFLWKSMRVSKLILVDDALNALKLALALTATTMVFVRSGPHALLYGSLLLLLFMASVGLRSHADHREERAAQGAPKAAAARTREISCAIERPSTPVDPELKARFEGALPLLKRNS